MNRLGLPSTSAMVAPGDHDGIKRIGRLVLICAAVLTISACLLIATALQVMQGINRADLDAARLRAANAIDTVTNADGPLTAAGAEYLGRVAGLRGAHLSTTVSLDPSVQQIPLLDGRGPSGALLTWTHTSSAEALFRQFAPIRLPIIAGMMVIVLGLLMRLRAIVNDIERQRRLAHRQSRSDVVTGLANRLAFETTLVELAASGRPLAILVFDLDRFKQVNDMFGHAAGDEVLRQVGMRLSALLGPDDLLARLGGDEFVLLRRHGIDRSDLLQLAHAAIAAVEAPIQLASQSVKVGISLGIVPSTAPHLAPADLLAQADAALYRAKSRPGSDFVFATDDPEPGTTPSPPRSALLRRLATA